MPNEPTWLNIEELLIIHEEQIAHFGGSAGIRDMGLIESAIIRPQILYHYTGELDVLTLAIRLGIGVAKNHGFVDGNKRTGAAAMIEFLELNGYDFDMPNDGTFGHWFEAVIEGRISEDGLAAAIYPFVRVSAP